MLLLNMHVVCLDCWLIKYKDEHTRTHQKKKVYFNQREKKEKSDFQLSLCALYYFD